MEHGDFSYQSCFCEENIWQLIVDPRLGEGPRRVVFLSNEGPHIALWRQRAGDPQFDELVVWDYHVIAIVGEGAGARVWDLDSSLGLDVPLAAYRTETFRPCAPAFSAMARSVEASVFRAEFSSDRRHMRDESGAFRQPPPPWPLIGGGHNLDKFIDPSADFLGDVGPAGAL